jgi:anti-sigma regulatory factor (Ser/Thr protein kinase)
VTEDPFRHEALFYGDEAEFVEGTTSFIRDGLAHGEPTLVVVNARKIGLLGAALGADADSVQFADMADVGRNPARIIPAWRRFVGDHAGSSRRLRGIGEPIWPERSQAELVECHRHESLLNLAFSGGPPFWLLCPYDTTALHQGVLDYANRNHAFLHQGRASRPSTHFSGLESVAAPFDEPLPVPDAEVTEQAIDAAGLEAIRRYVREHAVGAGLSDERTAAAVLAVSELAANSLHHGGGGGTLRSWLAGDGVVHEVRDAGHIDQPLVGRELPPPDGVSGRGLWLVNHLCDLVQLRSSPAGTVVRVHVGAD